ncbi:MAG: hypothetical protein COW88_01310 [Candidatus Lloydbacteria bacterium CG22_combo_CG10-13_8_21_14_all_47_15]|uniref:Carbonic anhydrase n=1 Tax=Candidatus Lloydbacteria bacterium CG22_combo_CG10-13_8_21_14_all_47_15 TaxID=1974635 RepID=A0A2H0CW56_9BACT|nr:MAG: hypothetical protein COW88_01310 [Candidatus Lloydbacteria bacterium CG22_combo_CG10-13_8_21_14_all_47_15]
MDIACVLHKVEKIIIVNHKDCGAYGGSDNFTSSDEEDSHHQNELRKARHIIAGKYPDKEIFIRYADFGEQGATRVTVL